MGLSKAEVEWLCDYKGYKTPLDLMWLEAPENHIKDFFGRFLSERSDLADAALAALTAAKLSGEI